MEKIGILELLDALTALEEKKEQKEAPAKEEAFKEEQKIEASSPDLSDPAFSSPSYSSAQKEEIIERKKAQPSALSNFYARHEEISKKVHEKSSPKK